MLFEMIALCPKLPTAGLDLFMFNTPYMLSIFIKFCYCYFTGVLREGLSSSDSNVSLNG